MAIVLENDKEKPSKTLREKAKEIAKQKEKEKRELEEKLGIPQTDIAYDLDALMKDKKLIRQNRKSARKLKEYQKEHERLLKEVEAKNQTETEREYHVFMASFSLTFSLS